MESGDESAFLARAIATFRDAGLVSFDVFDTALERAFDEPTDVFESISGLVGARVGERVDYRSMRVEAERKARRIARAAGRPDVTLDAIFDVLAANQGWATAVRDDVRAIELDAERACMSARPIGFDLYRAAVALGVPVVFTSDMYLPTTFVDELLRASGYDGHARVFVSGDVGETKGSGRMYGLVAREMGVPLERIVHLGDNARSDVHAAERAGVRALHLPRAVETARRARVLARRPTSLGGRAVDAHVARMRFDDPGVDATRGSRFGGDAHRLGVAGLGPLLLGFTKWLIETAIANRYEHLYFLARDGRIMLDAYRIVARGYPDAPPASYLLCSRRAANVASIRTVADLEARALPRKAPSTIAEFLLGRFGIERDSVPTDVLGAHGMSLDSLVSTPDVERVRALLRDLAPVLLRVAERERAAYLEYLAREGVRAGVPAAVVDIGYRGTMQASIDELTGGIGLAGLYLLTLHEAEDIVLPRGLAIDGYLGRLVDSTRGFHALSTFIPVYETLFSGSDTSLVRFDRSPEGPVPVFMPHDPAEERRIDTIGEVHAGALALVARVVDAFGPAFASLRLSPRESIAPLDAFLSAPDAEDARMLEGIPFENAYCAAGFIPVVAPGGRGESMWPEGSLALRSAGGAIAPALTDAALRAYASPVGRAFRVAPKQLAHAVVGRAMSTAAARELVKNPLGFVRARRAELTRRFRRG